MATKKIKLIRFSKPIGVLFKHKQSFFKENDMWLELARKTETLYLKQPRRRACKNCAKRLGAVTFYKMGIPYIVCLHCSHLNGAHEDTEKFCKAAYLEQEESYAADYGAENIKAYTQRVQDIYLPKAKFLKEALVADGRDPKKFQYADIGAGSGYFVAALADAGLKNATGYEVSETMVRLGQAMRPDIALKQMGRLDDVVGLARTVEADVVSLIGVLEHVQRPREVLAALRANPRVKYVFIFVPLFSPSVFFELAFPHVMQRVLSAEHTHLYTEQSIQYFCKEFGLRSVGEWWFGTDIMDLYRSLQVTLAQDPRNKSASALLAQMIIPLIDPLQAELDKSKLSSEVHMLLARKK